jgi:hypothetical protein
MAARGRKIEKVFTGDSNFIFCAVQLTATNVPCVSTKKYVNKSAIISIKCCLWKKVSATIELAWYL